MGKKMPGKMGENVSVQATRGFIILGILLCLFINPSKAANLWQMHASMSDSCIALTWEPPANSKIASLHLFRSTLPNGQQGVDIARLGAAERGYSDKIPNWTPYYYWVKAFDSNGKVVDESTRVAAFAHPASDSSSRVETFAFWYEPYKPITDPDSTLRHIGNGSFVVSDSTDAMGDLAKSGIGRLPYLTLYQTWQWLGALPQSSNLSALTDKLAPIAFYQTSARFSGIPSGYVPSIFFRQGNSTYPQAIQYTICPNSAQFRDMVFAFVRRQIASGASGFFIDNGYDDDIAATSPCQSTRHPHYYGDNLTAADAFLGMLMEITCAIKKERPNAVVMVNGAVPKQAEFYGLKLEDVIDGQLWESYLRSSYSTPREHRDDWDSVYQRSIDLERSWRAQPPRRMFVLSYPWDRQEAFFCYATAKLCNLPWSAGLGISDPEHTQFGGHFGTYPELVDLRLGAPLDPSQYGGEKLGSIYVRRYEKGFVAANPSQQAQEFTMPLNNRRCRDLFTTSEFTGNSITITLPAESGRVFLYRNK